MKYTILVGNRAFEDIQNAVDYYEEQQIGLSLYFEEELDLCFDTLKINPKFKVQYDDVRCLPLKKFPYNIHFRIDTKKKQVKIEAVFETHQDPSKRPK